MEKNERLAWRTKPRTYCFSSCPKRHCKRETLPNCKLKKNNFSGPEKLFFHFPFQTLLGAGTKLFRCLFQLPRAPLQRETLPNCKLKKQLFRPRKVVFSFSPSRHSWEQARSFSGAFSSCPERHCKGRPFQLQIKKQLFGLRKVVFSKSLSPRHALFSPTGSKKNNFSGSEKLFFSKAVLSARNALS